LRQAISLIAYANRTSLIAYGDSQARPRAFAPMSRTSRQVRLGKALRTVRTAHKLTQEDLAARADLHPTYISDVERGVRNPSWDVVARLAEGIGVPTGVIATEYDRLAQ
jgi:DNA-binding XRE family transcriptional regulator